MTWAKVTVFACRFCVCYLRWAGGSEFPRLGHPLCFPIQYKWPDRQAALPWRHSNSWEVCQCLADVVLAMHRGHNMVVVVHSCKHYLQNHHLLSPPPWDTSPQRSAQGSCTNAPSPGVFLPGEGRGIQFIADPLLNWSQRPSNLINPVRLPVYFAFLNLDEQQWVLNLLQVSQWVLSHLQTRLSPSHPREGRRGLCRALCSWPPCNEPRVFHRRHRLLGSFRTWV